MDEIQKVLIKAGRKDLAQEYYKKANPPLPTDRVTKEKERADEFKENLTALSGETNDLSKYDKLIRRQIILIKRKGYEGLKDELRMLTSLSKIEDKLSNVLDELEFEIYAQLKEYNE